MSGSADTQRGKPPADPRPDKGGTDFLDAFARVSEAVESGAGLPEVARATGRALNAGVAIVDSSSSVLAVACASPADERAVLSGGPGSDRVGLRVADAEVGWLLFRTRSERPPPALLRMLGALIALEVDRSRAPARATEAAVATFLHDLLHRTITDRDNIVAVARELGTELAQGASVLVARAHPHHPEAGDWRARVVVVAERGARAVERKALAAPVELQPGGGDRTEPPSGDRPEPPTGDARAAGELVIVVPGSDPGVAQRSAQAVLRELETGLHGFSCRVGFSRPAADPVDLHRAAAEALLAANVADANEQPLLAFEETGAYRLLLPAMSEDPTELRRFHEETVAPLLRYDEQYETELLRTLELFLEADGNVAKTAERLYTHRHTVRYRLERVRDLSGLDVSSSDGRERLGLGLKAMRVLGIAPPRGPASERGTEAGRVPREEQGR